jgi:hypothetical protein
MYFGGTMYFRAYDLAFVLHLCYLLENKCEVYAQPWIKRPVVLIANQLTSGNNPTNNIVQKSF